MSIRNYVSAPSIFGLNFQNSALGVKTFSRYIAVRVAEKIRAEGVA